MKLRDLLENHADIVYHAIAVLGGLVGLVTYVITHSISDSLIAFIGTFMAGGVANAKFNPNNS